MTAVETKDPEIDQTYYTLGVPWARGDNRYLVQQTEDPNALRVIRREGPSLPKYWLMNSKLKTRRDAERFVLDMNSGPATAVEKF